MAWRYHHDDWPERLPSAPSAIVTIAIAIVWAAAALVLLVVLALRFG